MVSSAFGLPTLWHCSQPLIMAAGPSDCVNRWRGRLLPPGWYFSEKRLLRGKNTSCRKPPPRKWPRASCGGIADKSS